MIWNAILAGFKDSGMDPRGGRREGCSRGFPVQRFLDGRTLVEEMHLGMRAHFMLKAYSTKNLSLEYQTFTTCSLERGL